MPTTAPHASSKATCNPGRIITSSFCHRAGGSNETNGLSAHLLRAVVDARLDERERVLREQIATTRRIVRELSR